MQRLSRNIRSLTLCLLPHRGFYIPYSETDSEAYLQSSSLLVAPDDVFLVLLQGDCSHTVTPLARCATTIPVERASFDVLVGLIAAAVKTEGDVLPLFVAHNVILMLVVWANPRIWMLLLSMRFLELLSLLSPLGR